MKSKEVLKILSVILALGMLVSYVPTSATAATGTTQQIVTVEDAVLNEMSANGVSTYWVDFKNTADLSKAYSMDWSKRGWFVYETLKAQADKTQAAAVAYLNTTGLTYKSYWIANRILVEQSNNVVLASLQQLPNVVAISAQKQYILYEPKTVAVPGVSKGIEPNISQVKAPEAWDLGFDGTGVIVANIDTGVRYSHQALVGSYRGNNGDGTFTHDYNWFNPYTLSDNVPRDGNGHGTHTMGTMVGNDGGSNQIGIAPGAEWMACAGCPDGTCWDSALLGCGEFITAPTTTNGLNPNPDMRPNVVNNSWGDCGQSYDDWYADVIDGWHAAGIYPVFSNGNNTNCRYSAPPGLNTVGNPARSGDVTGVGSSGTSNGQYASHSNWGPTDNPDTINPVAGFENLKPQVIAPGVNIRSSTPGSDTQYQAGWTGTSMSAPHVTGLVAMVWQAAPCLIGDYATTETLVEQTATPITYNDGSPLTPADFPNFASGWGEINALAAVQMAAGMCGNSTLYGTVTSDLAEPVPGAKVIITGTETGNSRTVYTNATGQYSARVSADTFDMTVTAFGYLDASAEEVLVADDASVLQDFVLTELSTDASWLLMYYMAADNNLFDTGAKEYVNINNKRQPNVDIAILYDAPGLDTSYRFISQGGELERIEKGNLNTGDGRTLTSFIEWAKSKSTAQKQALVIFDHGNGLKGVAWDDRNDKDFISINGEIRSAILDAGSVDIIWNHNCLTGNIEFMWELRGLTDYYVASESMSLGPSKHNYIKEINQSTSPKELAIKIAQSYYKDYDSPRTPSTISVVDMSYINDMSQLTHELAASIREAPRSVKDEVWNLTDYEVLQRFDMEPNGINNEDQLADLFHFVSLLQNMDEFRTPAMNLLNLEDDFVIFNRAWSGFFTFNKKECIWAHSNARGVSIELPREKKSFYNGDWIKFGTGANWDYGNYSKAAVSEVEGYDWGPMISELVYLYNPDSEDQPNPPDPVPLLIIEEYPIYLPLILR